jgi:hypothetical protein
MYTGLHIYAFVPTLINYTGYLRRSPGAAVVSPRVSLLTERKESLDTLISVTGMHIALLLSSIYGDSRARKL